MATVEAVGGRWKPRILWALRQHVHGFGELRRATGASSRMLAKSLQELERDGLIERRVIAKGSITASEYTYSSYGTSLIPVLDLMGTWGSAHQARIVK